MESMDLFEAIRTRRSHRTFERREVEPEKIGAILDAAHWAPSPANSQPWEFILVTGEKSRRRLYELSEQAKKTGRVEVRGFSYVRPLPQGVAEESGEDVALRQYSLAFLKNVPVIIGVVGLPVSPTQQRGQETYDSYKYSCGAVIENILLAATALGLGSLWFTLFNQQLLRQFLGVDPSKHLVALVCIGYPAISAPDPGRLPLETKVRRLEI